MKETFEPLVNESTPLVSSSYMNEDDQVKPNELSKQKPSQNRGNVLLKYFIACVVLSLMVLVSLRYSSSMNHSIVTTSGNNECLIT